jgi:hypothetical protein
MKEKEFQDLIDQSLNETISEVEMKVLEERMLQDPKARIHYLNSVGLHASLRRRFSSQQDADGTILFSGHSIFTRKTVWAIAACLVLFFGLLIFQTFNRPFAEVAHVIGAYRADGIIYKTGEKVEPGILSLTRGLLRLDFSNGARVTVEGPAELEVFDEDRVLLHKGLVTATIPESAVGFVVDTVAAHVVDLGTSFGVSVSDNGQTEVCVFDGEVEVSLPRVAGAEEVTHLVREGESISASVYSSALNPASSKLYENKILLFENALPVNYGVLQTTGSMRFVSPGPDFHPGNFKDNEHIVVFPEKRGFLSNESIRVDMIDPGEYEKSHYDEKPTLVPRRAMTSYLLQLDAYPEGENPNRRRSVIGQITFANPIVGVITEDRLLNQSEVVFGIPGADYPSARTIEPRPEGDERKGFDKLILTADRHSLILELRENPGHLDQVRVLVESH